MNALSGHLKGNLVLVVLTELIGSMLSVVSIRGFNSYKVTKGRVLSIQMKYSPAPSLLDARSRIEECSPSWGAGRSDLTSEQGRLASGTGSRISDLGLWRLLTTRPQEAACAWEEESQGYAGARPSGELTSVWRHGLEIEAFDLQHAEYRPLSSSVRPSCPFLLLQAPPLCQ